MNRSAGFRRFWDGQFNPGTRLSLPLSDWTTHDTILVIVCYNALMDTVYIETSIISHATARPNPDVRVAALQHQAREWWAVERPKFSLVTSQLTVDEASAGDTIAADIRLNLLHGLPLVQLGQNVTELADLILARHLMPKKAGADAIHIAAAAIGGVNYLLTQNCKHIANAHELPRVYRLLEEHGYGQLLICTPAEFLGGDGNDD